MPDDLKPDDCLNRRGFYAPPATATLWVLSGMVIAGCGVGDRFHPVLDDAARRIPPRRPPDGTIRDDDAFPLSFDSALTYENGMLALATGQSITVPGARPGDARVVINIPERMAAAITLTEQTPQLFYTPQLVYVDNTGATPALRTGARAEFNQGGTDDKYIIGVIDVDRYFDLMLGELVTRGTLHPVTREGRLIDLPHYVTDNSDAFARVEEGGNLARRTYDKIRMTDDAPRLTVNDVNTGQSYTYEFSIDGETWQPATGAPTRGFDRFGGTVKGQYGTLTLTDDPGHIGGTWSYTIEDAENPELANLYDGDFGFEHITIRVAADGGRDYGYASIRIGIEGHSGNVPFGILIDADGDNRNDAQNIAPGMAGNEGFIMHSGGEVSWVVVGGVLTATFKGGSFTRNNGERVDFAGITFTYDSYGTYIIALEESSSAPGTWIIRSVDASAVATLAGEHYRLGTLVVNAFAAEPQTIAEDEHSVFFPNLEAQRPYEAEIAGVKLSSALADHGYGDWDIFIDKAVREGEFPLYAHGGFALHTGGSIHSHGGEFITQMGLEIAFHYEDHPHAPDINDTRTEIVRKFLAWERTTPFADTHDFRFQEVSTRFAAEDTSGGSAAPWLTALEAAYPGLAGEGGSATITDAFTLTDGSNPDLPNNRPLITLTDTSDQPLTGDTITIDGHNRMAAFKIAFTDADATDTHSWHLSAHGRGFRIGPDSDTTRVTGSDAVFFIDAFESETERVPEVAMGTNTKIYTYGGYGNQAEGTIMEWGSLAVTGTGNTRTITFTPNNNAIDLVPGGETESLQFLLRIADFAQGTTDITPGNFAATNANEKSENYLLFTITVAPPDSGGSFITDAPLTDADII